MDLETIALIAMGGCLFLWLVVNFIITLHNVRKAKAAGLTVQVQCEKCGTIYEVTGKEATRPAMIKYKKSSRTHISNGAFVNIRKSPAIMQRNFIVLAVIRRLTARYLIFRNYNMRDRIVQ